MRQHLTSAQAPFPSFTSTWRQTSYPAIDPTQPALSAKGKNVFITGGGTGIGAATAQSFAAAGAAHVGILGRREAPLVETKHTIEKLYPNTKVTVHVGSIESKEQLDAAFSDFAQSGKIDVFVSNAAYFDFGMIKDSDPDAWMKSVDVNLKGNLLAAQAFLRHAAVDATVINVTSLASFIIFAPNISAYNVSKAATVTFYASLQIEHPEMRIVSIQPGGVKTDMNRKASGPDLDDASLPADFMVWLASPEAAFTKGKYLFANWDVEELKQRAAEISKPPTLEMWIDGLEYSLPGQKSGSDIFSELKEQGASK